MDDFLGIKISCVRGLVTELLVAKAVTFGAHLMSLESVLICMGMLSGDIRQHWFAW